MINRYAELLLLIGRLLERADNYSRIINVYYSMRDELVEEEQGYTWERLVAAVGDIEEFKRVQPQASERAVLHYLTFERSNEDSIFSCVQQARTHIRTLRPMLPVELWDIINSFYLWLKEQEVNKMMPQSPYMFYKRVNEWLSMFNGAADSTMVRGQSWNLLQSGKFLERLNGTVRIIHATYGNLLRDTKQLNEEARYNRFLVLLKSCGGYEAFRKFHAQDVRLAEVTEFLLRNAEFPRSVRFAIDSLASYVEINPLVHQSIKTLSIQTSDVLACIRANKQRYGDHVTEEVQLLLQQLLHSQGDLGSFIAEACLQVEEQQDPVEI
ncbi:alpha-E domain-containing protein [Paenibacillus sp. YAF4_2]|uniref:alpha-E domain-containing protein n=1 Tax=Paenibacillus sp. YAF4_2 TaxID=3233085 RepID=UPI003F9A200A